MPVLATNPLDELFDISERVGTLVAKLKDLESAAERTKEAVSDAAIANLLEQRSRSLPEPGALHLTRREDLLDLAVSEPDMELYDRKIKEERK